MAIRLFAVIYPWFRKLISPIPRLTISAGILPKVSSSLMNLPSLICWPLLQALPIPSKASCLSAIRQWLHHRKFAALATDVKSSSVVSKCLHELWRADWCGISAQHQHRRLINISLIFWQLRPDAGFHLAALLKLGIHLRLIGAPIGIRPLA